MAAVVGGELLEGAGGAAQERRDVLGDPCGVAVAVAGLLYGLLMYRFAREARGHGVPEVMIAVAKAGGRIRPQVSGSRRSPRRRGSGWAGFPPGIALHHARNYLLVAILGVVHHLGGFLDGHPPGFDRFAGGPAQREAGGQQPGGRQGGVDFAAVLAALDELAHPLEDRASARARQPALRS